MDFPLIKCEPIIKQNPDKKAKVNDVKNAELARVIKIQAPKVTDFWGCIAELKWLDVSEGKNDKPATQIWSDEQLALVKKEYATWRNDLLAAFDRAKLWENHLGYSNHKAMQEMLAGHVIAKGQAVYAGCLGTPEFAVAFMGEEQDFEGYLG